MPFIILLYVIGVIIVYKLAVYLNLNRRFWTLLAILMSPLVATLIIMFVWLAKLFKPNSSADRNNSNQKDEKNSKRDSDFDD